MINYIKALKGFDHLDVKYSVSEKKPFIRMKVKLKKEIVTMGINTVNPNCEAGEYIEASDWNELIEDKETILIDARNNYEYSIGTFKNSLNPEMTKFSEFPKWVKKQNYTNQDKTNKKVAMFCTGGIRCEKASALMKKEGFKNVFHLKGGILKYFESISEKESKWKGECFVFDDRVSLKHDLSIGSYDMCHGCRMPITEPDKKSEKYIKGVACPSCYDKTSEKQKSRYMSRQKQIVLAKKYNLSHIGPKEETFK